MRTNDQALQHGNKDLALLTEGPRFAEGERGSLADRLAISTAEEL